MFSPSDTSKFSILATPALISWNHMTRHRLLLKMFTMRIPRRMSLLVVLISARYTACGKVTAGSDPALSVVWNCEVLIGLKLEGLTLKTTASACTTLVHRWPPLLNLELVVSIYLLLYSLHWNRVEIEIPVSILWFSIWVTNSAQSGVCLSTIF